MRRFTKYTLCILTGSLFILSCIDNDYDTDKINKDATFGVPPIPIGDIDTIWVDDLPDVTHLYPYMKSASSTKLEILSKEQVIENLFTKDILDKFFNESATKDVILQSKADIHILAPNSGLEIDIKIKISDANGKAIDEIIIPSENLVYGDNQDFNIVFPVQYFKYMKNAKNLNLIFTLRAESISLTKHDFAYLKEIVLKSGGIHFEF